MIQTNPCNWLKQKHLPFHLANPSPWFLGWGFFLQENLEPINIKALSHMLEFHTLMTWEYRFSLLNIWLLPEYLVTLLLIILISYITFLRINFGKIGHKDITTVSINLLRALYFITFFVLLCVIASLYYKKKVFIRGILLINLFTLIIKFCILIIYILLIGILFFSFFLISSTNLFFTYLTLEGIANQSYTLAAFSFTEISITVALKYFLLGTIISGILLYGISFLYGVCNTLHYSQLANFFNIRTIYDSNLIEVSLISKMSVILLLFGLLFKLGAYPLHVWVPSVYKNSPNPVTILFATLIKFIISILILYVFYIVFSVFLKFLEPIFLLSALGSMVIGAFGASKEFEIKNFIGYTSINQAGFILLGLCCHSDVGLLYSLYYLFIYIILTSGFLGIILNLQQSGTNDTPCYFKDLKHLCKTDPILALILSTFLLSFAGLPPFAGFFAKLYIYFAIAKSKMLILLLVVLFINLISLYYYVRIIKFFWFENLLDFTKESLRYKLSWFIGINVLAVLSTAFNIFFLFFIKIYEFFIIGLFYSMIR
jgi:NADH-quinone oxidoreductase subunit N